MRYIIAVILLALPPIGWKGEEKLALPAAVAEAVVDSLGRDYYRAKFALYPAYATSKGVRDYDSELSTFSPRSVNLFLRRMKQLEPALGEFHEDSLSMEGWVDLQALRAEMATQKLLLEDFDLWHRSPILYSDACIDGIYYLLIRGGEADTGTALSARLALIPEVVASARANLTEPIRLHCKIASASLKDFLPFLEELGSQGTGGIAVEAGLLRQAGESLGRFAAYLDSLIPLADPEFHLGRENLVRLLQTKHMIDESPEDLIAYAERILAEAQADRRELFGSATIADIDTSEAGLPAAADVKAHLQAEIESARVFLRSNDLVTLPDNESLVVVETPVFFRHLVPGFAYEPAGTFDESQTGRFYVPPLGGADRSARLEYARRMVQRYWRGIVAHEAFPGHHVQITTANRHPSYIRKLQDNMFAIEGWAFYCEEMMARQGYTGDGGIGAVLGGIIFRAARVIVDIRLQLGEFSLDEAVDFMVKQTGAPRGFVETEVRRYAVTPTQAMSYLIGKREILALRQESKSMKGDSFSLKRFHDGVLSCGSLPPYLLKTCVISRSMGRL